MISASALLQQTNPFENSIQQILRLDGLKREQLKADLNTIEAQKKALSDIGSAFSSFQSIINNFADQPADAFKPFKAESTSGALRIISNEGVLNTGNFNIQVGQLARSDTFNSASFTGTGDDLSTQGMGSFEISVAGSDPVTISVDTTGLTNKEVLAAIRDSVNELAGERISASRIQTSDTDFAISIKSRETGSINEITINNIQGDFMNLNLNRLFELDQLDAQFTVDGIAMSRSSNIIENAIEGITFELVQTTFVTEQISVSRDTDTAMEAVQSFIDSFNKLNSEIRNKTFINAETGERGLLQRERSVRNLSLALRQSVVLPVPGLDDPTIQSITDLGITVGQDGTLTLSDSDKLASFLAQSPDLIEQLFIAPDGIVQNLKNSVESVLTGNNNLLDTIKNGMEARIDRTNNRIDRETRFLERREVQLRKEFSQLQQIIDDGERQFNQILSFQALFGFRTL
ncbi:MAG: flagellar filament capping protein FliD [Balneolaceae bacterium]